MNKYIRLIRPKHQIGTMLLFVPCVLGVLIGGLREPDFSLQVFSILSVKFLLGAFLTRSAGCVINDILDRKFDIKVERTKTRPIASGEISVKNAFIFMFLLLFLAFLILLTLPVKVIAICAFALVFVFTYPLFKRFTYFPQVFLGITFNIGLIAGFFAVSDQAQLSLPLLYIALILWTVIYDTLYAMQDVKDDIMIGVKSTALLFGGNYKIILQILNVFYLILILAFWQIYGLKFVIVPVLSFAVMAFLVQNSREGNFSISFKSSILACIILCFGVFLNYL